MKSCASPGSYFTGLSVTDRDGATAKDGFEMSVLRRPTAVIVEPRSSSTPNEITVGIALTDRYDPGTHAGGRAIRVRLDSEERDVIIDASGRAEVSLPVSWPVGHARAITAEFSGDEMYVGSTGVATSVRVDDGRLVKDTLLEDDAMGREFVAAFPHAHWEDNLLLDVELFITSRVQTSVEISAPGTAMSPRLAEVLPNERRAWSPSVPPTTSSRAQTRPRARRRTCRSRSSSTRSGRSRSAARTVLSRTPAPAPTSPAAA